MTGGKNAENRGTRNRPLCHMLCCLLALTLCGCGGGANGRSASQMTGVAEVLQQGMDNAEESVAETEAPAGSESAEESVTETEVPVGSENAAESVTDVSTAAKEFVAETEVPVGSENAEKAGVSDGIDVDLTVLSSTMVYSEVSNMVASPDEYQGKMIKMTGPFSVYHDESTDNYYYACIIEDATACCAQGIEFVLAGEAAYPEDYPEEGEVITVTGTFDTYMEGDYRYITLRNAHII